MTRRKTEAADGTAVEKTAELKVVPQKEDKKPADRMYIGPSISGVVRHGTVYKSGVLTEKINEAIKKVPSMVLLFVRMDQVPSMIRKLNDPNSSVQVICREIQNQFKEDK